MPNISMNKDAHKFAPVMLSVRGTPPARPIRLTKMMP